jgi:DNA mismatch endonuclease (patch repair protein)
MRTQRRRDTAPERLLRVLLHARGLRYYVDRAPLAGMRRRADVVFPRRRVAVFVDGCFWHCCPEHGTLPARNRDWWVSKLAANAARDRDTDARLRAAGWQVVRVWEHEDPSAAADRVEAAVRGPRRAAAS